jgi:hypothetical protein
MEGRRQEMCVVYKSESTIHVCYCIQLNLIVKIGWYIPSYRENLATVVFNSFKC